MPRSQSRNAEPATEPTGIVGQKRKRPSTATRKSTTQRTTRSKAATERSSSTVARDPPTATSAIKKKTSSKKAKEVLSAAQEKQKKKNQQIDESRQQAPVSEKLAQVDNALVQKVRRREILKQIEQENGTNEKRRKKSLLMRLPNLCNHIRAYFRSQKKSVLPLAEIQRKLCDLTTPASKLSEIEEMLEVLADIASSWCEIMMTADEEYYFHVHLKVPVSEAKKAIQAAMNELQED